MDEILYLEPDEEITSVIDKLKNAPSSKIGLVVPREATLLQSVVNLRLLSREASILGKEIAIVTADRIGRNLAAQVGIPVFNSIDEEKPLYQPSPPKPTPQEVIELDLQNQSQEQIEKPSGVNIHHFQEEKPIFWKRKEKPVMKIQVNPEHKKEVAQRRETDITKAKKIIWPILAILFVLGLVATYLLLPKATMTVFMDSEPISKSLQITVLSEATDSSLSQNVIPGTLVESTSDKEDKFLTSGKKNIGEKAKGTIAVQNFWESTPKDFVSGTKFVSSSKTFLSTKSFTLPGSSIKEGNLVPGSINVEISAENPGEEYNVKAGRFTIVGLPANQQEKIYGTSSSDLKGGLSKEVQVVSQDDYDKAKQKLIDEITTTLQKDFDAKVKNKKVLEKATVIPDPEIISSKNVDSEATEFTMKVILKKQAMVFDLTGLKEFIIKILEKDISSGKMVAIADDSDVGIIVDKTAFDKGEMDLTTNVNGQVSSKISLDLIKQTIIGKKVSVALDSIKSKDGVNRVEVKITPSWWFKKIPDLQGNVKVKLDYIKKESND